MANSTLIQSLIIGATADQSHRRQIETFLAGGTIVADYSIFISLRTAI